VHEEKGSYVLRNPKSRTAMTNKADFETYLERIACLCHDMGSKAVDEVVDSVGNLI
jgi:hypothetical protein